MQRFVETVKFLFVPSFRDAHIRRVAGAQMARAVAAHDAEELPRPVFDGPGYMRDMRALRESLARETLTKAQREIEAASKTPGARRV